MNLNDLKLAARYADQLKRAEADAEEMMPYQIVGIVVDRGGLSPITLQEGVHGCGSVTGIGFPKGLQEALNQAMMLYFEQQVEYARGELKACGISLD